MRHRVALLTQAPWQPSKPLKSEPATFPFPRNKNLNLPYLQSHPPATLFTRTFAWYQQYKETNQMDHISQHPPLEFPTEPKHNPRINNPINIIDLACVKLVENDEFRKKRYFRPKNTRISLKLKNSIPGGAQGNPSPSPAHHPRDLSCSTPSPPTPRASFASRPRKKTSSNTAKSTPCSAWATGKVRRNGTTVSTRPSKSMPRVSRCLTRTIRCKVNSI